MWQAARKARISPLRRKVGGFILPRGPALSNNGGGRRTTEVPTSCPRRFRSALARPGGFSSSSSVNSRTNSELALSTAPEVCVSNLHDVVVNSAGAVAGHALPTHLRPPRELKHALWQTLAASQQLALEKPKYPQTAPGESVEFMDQLGSVEEQQSFWPAKEDVSGASPQLDPDMFLDTVEDTVEAMEEPWVDFNDQERNSSVVQEQDFGLAQEGMSSASADDPFETTTELGSSVTTTSELSQPSELEAGEEVQFDADIEKMHQRSIRIKEFGEKISGLLNKNQVLQAFMVLEKAIKEGVAQDLREGTVRTIFFELTKKNPDQAHRVLKFYQHMTRGEYGGDLNAYHKEYVRLCASFEHLDPQKIDRKRFNYIVLSTVRDLPKLELKYQEKCYPVLVSSLAAQRIVSLWSLANKVFEYMVEQNFAVPPGYWEHLLSRSRFNRQNDLPYALILERSVEEGQRPTPHVVLNCLGNLFPYKDTGSTYRILKSILELQRKSQDGEEPYQVDISTLEMAGAAAVKTGFYDMNMVVWDLADALNIKPTASMYENTILAFCARRSSYTNAFAVLSDMQEKGMEPSPALVRSMSTQIRECSLNLDVATNTLRNFRARGRPISVAALNAVLSASAERGDVDRTMALLNDFSRDDVEPNVNSYNYAFEALGKRLGRKLRRTPVSDEEIALCLDTADYLLGAMEEKGIEPDHHLIRNYVELLCITKEVDTANNVVRGSLEEAGLINNKILYRVAVTNAEMGHFDTAREMAGYAIEPMPFLLNKIKLMESDHENSGGR